ncbi:MAG: J domain-containing protein [Nitrospinales bacterium]
MALPEYLKNYNLYRLLEVETFSDTRQIKKGYRDLALKYHPDRFPTDKNSALKFELATTAYKFLLNTENRFSHDRMLRGKMRGRSRFRNKEFVLQRRKTHKGFYTRQGTFDGDYHRFIDECRANFIRFMQNPSGIEAPRKIYSEKDMGGRDFENFVDGCRSDFQSFLKTVPRVRKERL